MVKIKELDCGIRVAMDKMPEVQSVSLGIWVHDRQICDEFILRNFQTGTQKFIQKK